MTICFPKFHEIIEKAETYDDLFPIFHEIIEKVETKLERKPNFKNEPIQ